MPRKKTNAEFVAEIAHRPLVSLEPYQTNKIKIRFQCTADGCGHLWSTRPDHITNGKGCPRCADDNKRKPNAEFIEQIKGRGITPLETYKGSRPKIRVRCDVDGHEWSTSPSHIIQGHGCPECYRQSCIGTNDVICEEGNCLLIDISTETHPDAVMMVDTDMWERYEGGRVTATFFHSGKYIYACYREGRRTKRFHHFVSGKPPKGMETDHIHHGDMSFVNNCRSNLRTVSVSQNSMNRSVRVDNKNGATGIYYYAQKGKWTAYISINKKCTSLGSFDSKSEAIKARKDAERYCYGEFAFSANNK